jgi:hypothetical protein
MFQNISCINSTFKIISHALPDQILSLNWNSRPWIRSEIIGSFDNFLCNHIIIILFIIEGRNTTEENVKHNTNGPDITSLIIFLIFDNLWCNIICSTKYTCKCTLWPLVSCWSSEIYQFDNAILFLIDEHVFGLQISMNDTKRMTINNCLDNLFNIIGSCLLVEMMMLGNLIK